MTVSVSLLFIIASRSSSDALLSCDVKNAVPICTPSAPKTILAKTPLPSIIPPAAMTGIETTSTICGTKDIVPTIGN